MMRETPILAISTVGATDLCVRAARKYLETTPQAVGIYTADGVGGNILEAHIRDGFVAAVLDLTTTELANHLFGGIHGAGPDRLTAAALAGIPQVISVGGLDMIAIASPDKHKGRQFWRNDAVVTIMRTTSAENYRLGKEIAQKASAATGPTAVVLPLKGVSALDQEGEPFWSPEADRALFQSIRNWLGPQVELIEADLHINDAEFARIAVEVLLRMIE